MKRVWSEIYSNKKNFPKPNNADFWYFTDKTIMKTCTKFHFVMNLFPVLSHIWLRWPDYYECVRISVLNTTLDIYLLFENDRKSTQTRCKVCSNLTKSTTTIDFRLTIVFFINLEHFSHPTLALLFIIWKGKWWLTMRHELFIKIKQLC